MGDVRKTAIRSNLISDFSLGACGFTVFIQRDIETISARSNLVGLSKGFIND